MNSLFLHHENLLEYIPDKYRAIDIVHLRKEEQPLMVQVKTI